MPGEVSGLPVVGMTQVTRAQHVARPPPASGCCSRVKEAAAVTFAGFASLLSCESLLKLAGDFCFDPIASKKLAST
jgi:hypothetical protein